MITPSDQLAFTDVEGRGRPQDTFCMMMDAQLVLYVPEKVADERTSKHKIKTKSSS